MYRIYNYDLIVAITREELRKKVMDAIAKGWQPLDGCAVVNTTKESITQSDSNCEFYQTMVQYKKTP